MLFRSLDPDQRQLLDACVRQIALAIERDLLSLQAYEARLDAESERLRSSLLSSVSHDLRTPLAVIRGASSSVADSARDRLSATEQSLVQSVVDEADRLARLVDNLLDMSRLESPTLALKTEPQVLEDVVGAALGRMDHMLEGRPIHVSMPRELVMVDVDGILVEQLLVNLLENAARYTPPGGPIDVQCTVERRRAVLRVQDRGPGLEPGGEKKVFEKFYRGRTQSPDSRRGVGLGLAICKAIADAHQIGRAHV